MAEDAQEIARRLRAAVGTGQLLGLEKLANAVAGEIAEASALTDPDAFANAMLTWFNSLPTEMPAEAGKLWNNGGVLSQS